MCNMSESAFTGVCMENTHKNMTSTENDREKEEEEEIN